MNETLNKLIIALIIVLSGIFIINRSNQDKIDPGSTEIMSVSYTHLTLPTNREV